MDWQAFVLTHGRSVKSAHLAAIVGQPVDAITRFRSLRPCRRSDLRTYVELFTAFRGRAPRGDADYPKPSHGGAGAYDWLPNEEVVLASLVGRLSSSEIATVLTKRLQKLTGDATAERNTQSVQLRMNRIGLQAGDYVGGISIRAAVRRCGETLAVVQQAVHSGEIKTLRVGNRHVIPIEELQRWHSARDHAPAGWIRLSTVAKALQIRSDSKLPEYAKAGYVPDTVFVKASHLWFIKPERADQIIADARAGRPLPWHGKPFLTNLRVSWRRLQARRHRRCRVCIAAWGAKGSPKSFKDYCRRYPELDLGIKRHLTIRQDRLRAQPKVRPWGSCRAFRGRGQTIAQTARALNKPRTWVHSHIARGTIRPLRDAEDRGSALRISPAGMRRLLAVIATELRGRPRGHDLRTWLGLHAAAAHAGVSITAIQVWDRHGDLRTKQGPRGRLYSQDSVEARARRSWAEGRVRNRDAAMPAWLVAERKDGAA